MSGAGHVLDMIKRMSQNRSMRASKKEKFKGGYDISVSKRKLNKDLFKEISKEELDAIKAAILKKSDIQKRNEIIIWVIAMIIIVGILIMIN